MKKQLLTPLLLLLFLATFMGGQASAWTYNIGDDGWWGGVHYNLDKFEFFILSDDTFFEPSQTGFSVPGWTASRINLKYSLATGPAAGTLFWTFHFADIPGSPVTLDWLAYCGGILVGDARVTFTGGSFSYFNIPNPDPNDPLYDRTAVPLPPSFLLLGSALAGLGLLGWRRSRERA